MQTDVTDALDRQILHCLQREPRASFRRIADVVECSEQTVARRYRRLRTAGIIRVVAAIGPAQVSIGWMMRVRTRPSAASAIADALAAQDNVAWVSIVGAGSELLCSLRARGQIADDDLLLQRLPRTAEVLGLSAHAVLHVFNGRADDWTGYQDLLSEEQQARLRHSADQKPAQVTVEQAGNGDLPFQTSEIDAPLMTMLAADGRATLTELARQCVTTEARVSRRLDLLLSSGWLRLEVEIATAMLGFGTGAYLWLSVGPADLHSAGTVLAGHPQVSFVGAISGASNLLVAVICRNPAELYDYLTTQVATVPGLHQVETSLTTRRVKHERSLQHGSRLRE
jgi:DNA-binding Lrp family transcriptional regulator